MFQRLIFGFYAVALGLPSHFVLINLYTFVAFHNGDTGGHSDYYVVLHPEYILILGLGYFVAGSIILPRFFKPHPNHTRRAITASLLFFPFFLLAFSPDLIMPGTAQQEFLELQGTLYSNPAYVEMSLGFLSPLMPSPGHALFGFSIWAGASLVGLPPFALAGYLLSKLSIKNP